MSKIDLHIHSNCSDGSDNIRTLIQNIQEAGIEIFALTDHDTVEGCEEMEKLVPKNIRYFSGVELTCIVDTVKCHILGFNCDYKNETLLNLIRKGKDFRKIKLETRIKYLRDNWSIEFTKDELDWLYTRKSIVKTHIANILVNRGLAKDNVSAMKKYLDGCKSGDTRFGGEEAIKAITESGGIPIWAHPLGGEGEEHISENEFYEKLKVLKSIGIQGLECYYSRYSIEECTFLVKAAHENSLYISGGSDYHGTNKTIPLGRLNTDDINIDPSKLNVLDF